MKIERWYDVCCDKCFNHLCDFGSDMQSDIKLARKVAKSLGWEYIKETNENICPKCIEEERYK